jgi:hypothetical protein
VLRKLPTLCIPFRRETLLDLEIYKRVGIVDSVVHTHYTVKRETISSSSADKGSGKKSSHTTTMKFCVVETQSSRDRPAFAEPLSSRERFTLQHRLWRRPKGITGKIIQMCMDLILLRVLSRQSLRLFDG